MQAIRIESGMKLCYEDEKTFLIEDFIKDKRIQNIRCVEFITQRKENVFYFVEAKKGAPNPQKKQHGEEEEKSEDTGCFKQFIQEIIEKTIHSHIIFYEILLKRHCVVLPQKFMPRDCCTMRYVLVVIIKNHEKEWLVPIHNALQQGLASYCKASQWGGTPLVVMNESMALAKGFIKAE
ncbi:MAG: hypothetical protein PHN64_07070 [Desulfovibrionaceae bacterium]|nr:hypothetical protein [Desulfovibrionaceae bacterium]